jgi:hypothetical protein
MRRILLVLTVAAIMVAMLAASALPTLAAVPGTKKECMVFAKEVGESFGKELGKSTKESCKDLPPQL